MNIMRFIRALSPKVTKAQVLDSLNSVRTELGKNVIPRYQEFNRDFRNHKYLNKELQTFEKMLQQRLHSKDGLTVMIEDQLSKMEKGLSTIEKFVNAEFNEAIYKEAVNFLQANILQYISLASYVTRYARNYLTVILVEEAKAAGQDSGIKIIDAEMKRLKENQKAFVNAIPLTSLDSKDLEKRISKIPKAFVTEESAAATARDVNTFDPLRMNFFDTKINPLFLFGMLAAEWEADSYREAVEDYETQESLLVNLQLAQRRENDPKLEERIKRQLDTVTKLRQKLDEKEKKYGLK